jgi:DNA-binding transcriptional regulator GbsR (MarR family)
MTTQEFLGIILTSLSIVALLAGFIKWYIQTQTKPMNDKIDNLCEAISDVRAETKTNGGSSMRDEIKAIKREQESAAEIRKEQKDKIDHLYDLFIEYISSNKK